MLQEILKTGSLQKPTLENSIWYNGHTFSFLLTGEETGGAFTLIHNYFRKGGEPPAHYHRNEDEMFYVLEGEIQFRIGDKKFVAKAGDVVFAPREVPHKFSLITNTAKALLMMTPAGFEVMFKEFSVPAQSLELPPIPKEQPPASFFKKMIERNEELGVVWMPEF